MNIRELFEQAFSRSDMESKITGLSEPILLHLVKLLKWSDEVNYDKHINDINQWLFTIQRYTPKSNIKAKFYKKWIFLDWLGTFEFFEQEFNRSLAKYKRLNVIATNKEVYDKILDLADKISADISNKNFNGLKPYLIKMES